MKTVRLTMAQALVRFLENQYMEVDGAQHRFVRGVFIIPGHGNVVGLGQALSQEAKHLEIYQGKNEQGMAQAAVAFAKQMKRKQICVATSSVGPGAARLAQGRERGIFKGRRHSILQWRRAHESDALGGRISYSVSRRRAQALHPQRRKSEESGSKARAVKRAFG